MLEGPFNQFLSKEMSKSNNPEKFLEERLKDLKARTLTLNKAREIMATGFSKVLEGLSLAYPDLKLDDPNLTDTPDRVARALIEVCAGLGISDKDAINASFPSEKYNEVVILRNIDFNSLCSHHFFPFSGVAHVGYLPDISEKGRVVGLSKLARIVDVHARRPQLQERLCYNVMEALRNELKPAGVMVVMEASHGCLTCRGALKQNARMITSALDGKFRDDHKLRTEFLDLIRTRE